MITLSQLAIYPVKSTAQITLNSAQISPFGLLMDRRWMLIDDNGVMLTQRKHPRMCLIQCSFTDTHLVINAPDMPALKISLDQSGNSLNATVWKDTCRAMHCGNSAVEWFSAFLNTPARLVFFPGNENRQVDLNYASKGDITAFSDGFPYLLISEASLSDLNSRLSTTVDMRRFRPNLVVSGTQAFAEDGWKQIRIGEITFNLVKPCSRCSIPSINPDTAEQAAEVVKTLAAYRMQGHKILFGQNLIAEGMGKLDVGMEVEILA
jgi:MOSC domain-containing protein